MNVKIANNKERDINTMIITRRNVTTIAALAIFTIASTAVRKKQCQKNTVFHHDSFTNSRIMFCFVVGYYLGDGRPSNEDQF